MSRAEIFRGYAAEAAQIVPRFEALSSAEVLAPVMDLLPSGPARVLDIGAGTGRDAAWLAAQGHRVVAAEPVDELRQAGMALHASAGVTWLSDCLPELVQLRSIPDRYDLILAVGVWQHLRPEEHAIAVESLAALTAPAGRTIVSLRHGPGSPSRPCFPADPERIAGYAERAGMRSIAKRRAPSLQAANRSAGVTWTWLCLERGS